MGEDSLCFGDIFKYNNQEYIFLASTLDVIYVAKILSTENSKKLNNYCTSQVQKNCPNTDTWLLCFIMLTTEELKDRAAQFGKPELEDYKEIFHKLSIYLNNRDLVNLKKEVLNTRTTPIALKEAVREIKV